VRRYGPDDRFVVGFALWRLAGHLTREEIVALIRSSGHDPVSFIECAKPLIRSLTTKPGQPAQIRQLVEAVRGNHLPIGEMDGIELLLDRCLSASAPPLAVARPPEAGEAKAPEPSRC
jgi:hypothetical protein